MEELNQIPGDTSYYETKGIDSSIPSTFDKLSPAEMSEVLDYLKFHYSNQMSACRKLGNHAKFVAFVGTRPYLYLFWQLMQDCPIELQTFVMPKLPDNVKSTSTNPKKRGGKCTPKNGKVDEM